MKLLKAKNFSVRDTEGDVFDLFKYTTRSWLLLVFFRGEWCQHCRKQLIELNDNVQWFTKRNIKVVTVSADDNLYTSILKEILKSKIIILSDEDWKVFSLYGFKKPIDHREIQPALFLINPEHQIIFRYLGKNYRDRLTMAQLKIVCKKHV